jgi:23S rRNA (guanosine2251-2'-O)-methyltransferase
MKIYGLHTVKAILNSSLSSNLNPALKLSAKAPISRLFVSDRDDARMQELLALANRCKVPVEVRSRKDLDQMSQDGVHQGVVAEFVGPSSFSEMHLDSLLEAETQPPFLLALDGIQDPHNIGAILRSAEIFGVSACISSKDRSGDLTAVARKVASGGAELVPFIQVTNLVRTLKNLQENDYWIIGMAGEGSASIYQFAPPGKVCLVLGSEGDGLRRLTRDTCDELCHIPMYGNIESLNVSVAAGIALSAIRSRQG